MLPCTIEILVLWKENAMAEWEFFICKCISHSFLSLLCPILLHLNNTKHDEIQHNVLFKAKAKKVHKSMLQW